MNVADVAHLLEALAPTHLAQEWDNVGLLVGDAKAKVTRMLFCVDLTAAVLNEAIERRVELVLAYHPVIFKSLLRVTPETCPVVFEAVRRGVSVYSVHTAYDVVPGGTNDVLAEAMGLSLAQPLEPLETDGQCKIVIFVPIPELGAITDAAFSAGAGRVGEYFDCSLFTQGIGTFCGGAGTSPAIGRPGHHEMVDEMRLEITAPKRSVAAVCHAIRQAHSYETPAIDVYPMLGAPEGCGMGRVGELARPVKLASFVKRVKQAIGLKHVMIARAAGANDRPVEVAAVGAGSCGSLFRKAIAAGADVYVTGEMRHHDLLAATADGMTVICLGHSNSERIAVAALARRCEQLTAGVEILVSDVDRDPLDVA